MSEEFSEAFFFFESVKWCFPAIMITCVVDHRIKTHDSSLYTVGKGSAMVKKVYLFELDSVRNSEKEIDIGQKALFEELVVNRNQVILSFNQLADSQVFLAAIKNRESYEEILKLFEMGSLKVSLFGGIRTPSQYMQDSLGKCLKDSKNSFRFSGIPVEQLDKDLLNEIKLALQYCDPERLYEMYQNSQSDSERKRLEYLYRYVKMILLLSEEKTANNPAKTSSRKIFMDFIQIIRDHYRDHSLTENLKPMDSESQRMANALHNAFSVLDRAENMIIEWADEDSKESVGDKEKTEKKYLNDRSNWYKALDMEEGTDSVCLAEAIVDLCYNYTIEDSISDISRHYSSLENDFIVDFEKRLGRYWSEYTNGIHVFHEVDRTDCIEFDSELPNWKMAVRLYENNSQTERGIQKAGIIFNKMKILIHKRRNNDRSTDESAMKKLNLYENNLTAQRRAWKWLTYGTIAVRVSLAVFYGFLFALLDMGIDFVRNGFNEISFNLPILGPLVLGIAGAVLFGVASSKISSILGVPDIMETVQDIKQSARDLFAFRRVTKGVAYVRTELIGQIEGGWNSEVSDE